jgi:nucleotide-binding universal stress UspA family protein
LPALRGSYRDQRRLVTYIRGRAREPKILIGEHLSQAIGMQPACDTYRGRARSQFGTESPSAGNRPGALRRFYRPRPPIRIRNGPRGPQFDPEWRAQMKKEFEGKWCKRLRDAGVRHRTVMEDGRAASLIAKVADGIDADVIVVGRRGRGGVAELVLGSVSQELVRHSKRPILLISTVAQPRAARRASTSRPRR